MSIYTENGYKNRKYYLDCLAIDHDLPRSTVYMLADLLGPDEDFDGLVSAVEDAEANIDYQARAEAMFGRSIVSK